MIWSGISEICSSYIMVPLEYLCNYIGILMTFEAFNEIKCLGLLVPALVLTSFMQQKMFEHRKIAYVYRQCLPPIKCLVCRTVLSKRKLILRWPKKKANATAMRSINQTQINYTWPGKAWNVLGGAWDTKVYRENNKNWKGKNINCCSKNVSRFWSFSFCFCLSSLWIFDISSLN